MLVTWVARSCPLIGCVPWLSFSKQRCSSCAGLRPLEETFPSMGLDIGKVEVPYSASPVQWEDEGESVGEGHGVRC